MKVIFLGPESESRGLSLAGVEPERCDSTAAAAAALVSARRRGSGIGLVLVSPSLASQEDVARLRLGSEAPPAVLVLPEPSTRTAGGEA